MSGFTLGKDILSYVAVGDSFTEGLDDPYPDSARFPQGRYRGWADRFAEHLARHVREVRYANLAVRGKLLRQILTEQLPRAVELRPDLVTLCAGGNDILRPGSDPDTLADAFEDYDDALLDAVDFPAGWASESPESAHKRGTGVPLPEEDACRRLFDHDGKARAARAAFARTRTGPFVTTVVTGYDEPADARRALRAFREAARECDTFHAEDPAYWEDVFYWTTPTADCIDGRTDVECVDYTGWVEAWNQLRS